MGERFLFQVLDAQRNEPPQVREVLVSKKAARHYDWSLKEIEVVRSLGLLSAKPQVYLVNLSAADFERKKNKWLAKIKAWVDENSPGDPIVPYSADTETKILAAGEESETLAKIASTGYHHLGLIHFFTVGEDEVKCWTIRSGLKAPQAAGCIHSDFEKNFIMAETYSYEDWEANGRSVANVKAKGLYRNEGKQYTVQDGDILLFKFGTSSGAKGAKK